MYVVIATSSRQYYSVEYPRNIFATCISAPRTLTTPACAARTRGKRLKQVSFNKSNYSTLPTQPWRPRWPGRAAPDPTASSVAFRPSTTRSRGRSSFQSRAAREYCSARRGCSPRRTVTHGKSPLRPFIPRNPYVPTYIDSRERSENTIILVGNIRSAAAAANVLQFVEGVVYTSSSP